MSKQNKISAGLLMYRMREGQPEVFLAHPGGPLFKNKDEGHWSIPKGEIESGEDLLAAAIREFKEETGLEPRGDFIGLGAIKQKGGKIVHAWAFPGEWDEARPLQSNTFELEWPPRSGKIQRFPEIDRAGFFSIPHARQKLKEAQHPFLDRLVGVASEILIAAWGLCQKFASDTEPGCAGHERLCFRRWRLPQ